MTLRNLVALVVIAFFAPAAAAAGLVQLSLSGMLEEEAGGRVQITCEAGGRSLSFHGYLGYETSAGDLAALLGQRMKAAGIKVTLGPEKGLRGSHSLFVEACESVSLRLGHGLRGRVTSMEEAPQSLSLLPPRAAHVALGGELRVSLALFSQSSGQSETLLLDMKLPAARPTASLVSERLSAKAMAMGLRSSRPTGDSWMSDGTHKGALTVGLSAEVNSYGDWGLELRLAPLVRER